MKKLLKIILVLTCMALIFFLVDYIRIKNQKLPIFATSLGGIFTYQDGGTQEYYGLGYKVIDFNRLGGYNAIKIGTWFMKYDDFKNEFEIFEHNNEIYSSSEIMNLEVEIAEGKGIEKITSDEKIDKIYPYDIYYKDIEKVTINFANESINLKEALKWRISLENILIKVEEDVSLGIAKMEELNDGGTRIYTYDNFCIVKYHTLDGNSDVYIQSINKEI